MEGSGVGVGPKEIFISYGREPHVIAFVCRLKGDLEQNGFTVWLDLEDISSGSDWHEAIGGGLYECQAIIPVITNKYLSSTYCIKELYTADGDRRLIFPIILEEVDMDKDKTSQGVKFTISSINWTMCREGRDDYNSSISRLIQDMKERGLGDPNYSGPKVKVQLGEHPALDAAPIGPSNTSEPILVLRDAELPGGIATGPDDEIIFTSGQKHSITICKGEEKVKEFGKCGLMEDQDMISPAGVVVNDNGEIVVACQYFLKRFNMEGKFVGKVGDFKDPEGDLTLHGPQSMEVGKEGRVYVLETAKNRVKIFNSDFSFHSCFSEADRRLGPGHLNNPMDLAINSKGEVYVADLSNNAIQVFTPDGEFIFRFGKQGHTLGCIQSPMAIAIDREDHVYIASGTGTISIFEIQGKDAKFIKAFGSHGSELGQFNVIRCMHIDRQGKLYVGEMSSKRIQVFQ